MTELLYLSERDWIIKKKWEPLNKSYMGNSTTDIHTEKEIDIGHGETFTLGIGPKEDGVTDIN